MEPITVISVGQIEMANIEDLQARWSLLQLLNSAIVVCKAIDIGK